MEVNNNQYMSLVGRIRLRANGRNIVVHQLPTLLDVTCCVRLHTLLHVVGCCCVLLRKVWNRSNFSADNSQHFFCSVIAEAYRNTVGSICTALPTLFGPPTLITHGLQRRMGCILPTMQCRSQHCWRNNVGSYCVRLHAALGLQWREHLLKVLVTRVLVPVSSQTAAQLMWRA